MTTRMSLRLPSSRFAIALHALALLGCGGQPDPISGDWELPEARISQNAERMAEAAAADAPRAREHPDKGMREMLDFLSGPSLTKYQRTEMAAMQLRASRLTFQADGGVIADLLLNPQVQGHWQRDAGGAYRIDLTLSTIGAHQHFEARLDGGGLELLRVYTKSADLKINDSRAIDEDNPLRHWQRRSGAK
jgi:hypothetical protein